VRILALLLLTIAVTSSHLYAGDSHENDGQGHRIVYVILDASGNPVSGQTVRLSVHRASDDAVFDFNDSLFKFTAPTTRYRTMGYNAYQEVYQYTFTPDVAQPRFASGDIVFIVSNDDSTYGDQQAEVVNFGNTNQLLRLNR